MVGSLAGCISGADPEHDGPVLEEPSAGRMDETLPYPVYGEEVPSVSVPDAFEDETISTEGFRGERHQLLTFISARCDHSRMVVEPLGGLQSHAIENGYHDEIATLVYTFDPEHDTPEVLREFGDSIGAEANRDGWHFLRPETETRAQEVVTGSFGVDYERALPFHDHEFHHRELVLLVNEAGFVERAYVGGSVPSTEKAIEDVRTLRERW